MKKTITMFFIATLALTSCNNSSSTSSSDRPKTPEELKAELKQQEEIAPLTYLEDKNVKLKPQEKKTRDAGLFRDAEYAPDGAIIEGEFINKATIAKFKDITVKVSFYSQTKTLIDEKNYVIYEFYEPNSKKPFKLKIDELPQAYKEFGFEITGATPSN
jgi:hypothetical protein